MRHRIAKLFHVLHARDSEVFFVRPILLIQAERLIEDLLEVLKYLVDNFLLLHLRLDGINPRRVSSKVSVSLFLDISAKFDVHG